MSGSTALHIPSFLDQITAAATPQRRPKGVPHEIALATAVLLLEVANCDDRTTLHEKATIHSALKNLYSTSDEATAAIMDEAKNTLLSMRGSSSFALILKENLGPSVRERIAEVIDLIICSDSITTDFETYFRNRFRLLLGLSIPDSPRADDRP